MAHAVVIGSGVGGAAATLLLAHAGLKVTLLEKNPTLGGSCAGYEKRGFRIDIGTHMFSRGPRGPLGAVLRRVGHDGAIPFRQTPDIAELRAIGRDGRLLRVVVPASRRRLPRLVWELARVLELSPREALDAARLFTHLLAMSDDEVERWNHRSVEDLLLAFAPDEGVVAIFAFLLGLYFVLPFWEVSAGEALWCFRRMVRDHWLSYPLGGSRAVPTTYVDLARRLGARVRTGAGVRKVLVDGGRACGVVLASGDELRADVVVSTSSVRTTALHLVGEQHLPPDWVERARRLRGSYIAVQAKLALDRPLLEAGAIVGGVGDRHDLLRLSLAELRELFTDVTHGKVPRVVPFYCPVPSNFDPSLAPPGKQLLTVCALAPTSDVARGAPGADPHGAWEEAMLATLRRVVPHLDDHVEFMDRFSVKFIEHWIGKEHGPAISTGQTPDQVGPYRPTVRTPLPGLYLAGCGAGGRGVGTELAASSALECTDAILADLGRGRRSWRLRPLRPLQRLARAPFELAAWPLAWVTAPG